jgi:hypothetical protein
MLTWSGRSWKRAGRSTPDDLAQVLPYLTEQVKRFGEYSTHELGIQPEKYDLKLDVDFIQLATRT